MKKEDSSSWWSLSYKLEQLDILQRRLLPGKIGQP